MLTGRTLITLSRIITSCTEVWSKMSAKANVHFYFSDQTVNFFRMTLLSCFIIWIHIMLAASTVVQWVVLLPHGSRFCQCRVSHVLPVGSLGSPVSKKGRWIGDVRLPQVRLNWCEVLDSCHIQDVFLAHTKRLPKMNEWTSLNVCEETFGHIHTQSLVCRELIKVSACSAVNQSWNSVKVSGQPTFSSIWVKRIHVKVKRKVTLLISAFSLWVDEWPVYFSGKRKSEEILTWISTQMWDS